MAVCEPVSRESLLANFNQMPGSVVSPLRTIIVGPDFAVRDADVSGGVNQLGQYDQTIPNVYAWPNLGATNTVDTTTADVFVSEGLVNYYADVAVVPGANEGAVLAPSQNIVVHNGGATIWSGPNFDPFLNVAVAIGDYVKLDDNGANTFETTVIGFNYVAGNPTGLILADNVPAPLNVGNFNVILAEIVTRESIPSGNLTLTDTQITVAAAVSLQTDRTGVTAYPLILGDLTNTATALSILYVDYRALRQENTLRVQELSTPAELSTYFVGYDDPESALGFAVQRALAPVTDPPLIAPNVQFLAITTNDSAGYQEALNKIARRDNWYSLAMLTQDETILNLALPIIQARRLIGLDSTAFFSLQLTLEETLLSGAGNTVLVDDSLTVGQNRTVTRDGGVADPFVGVQAGDLVTIAGVVYTVESFVSNQTVIITSAAIAGALQALTSVVHPLTPQEQVTDFGTRASAYADENIDVIFPPDPLWLGEEVGGELLAAATAGLRGYTMPHQSLRGVGAETGWQVPQSAFDFYAYLTQLAEDGVFVYDAYEPNDDQAYVLYDRTTDQSDALTQTEGIVANQDGIERYIKDLLSCYEGRTKITNATINDIQTEATDGLQFLRTNTVVQPYGAILITGVVGRPYQLPSQANILVVPINVTIAVGLEELAVQITVALETING